MGHEPIWTVKHKVQLKTRQTENITHSVHFFIDAVKLTDVKTVYTVLDLGNQRSSISLPPPPFVQCLAARGIILLFDPAAKIKATFCDP